jgi:hypothetical protein
MQTRKKIAAAAAAGACVLAGAAAGISQSSATSSSNSSTGKSVKPGVLGRAAGAAGMRHFGHGVFGDEVHASEVVLNKAGTDYITVTRDNGTITAVDASAGKITLKEGTSSVTYATPTITIPSGATVLLNGSSSSLEKLSAGDKVSISSSSEGTTVFATDSSFKPPAGPDGMQHPAPPQGAPQGAPQGGPQGAPGQPY